MKKNRTKDVTRNKETLKDLSPTAKQEKGVKGGVTTLKSTKSNSSE